LPIRDAANRLFDCANPGWPAVNIDLF